MQDFLGKETNKLFETNSLSNLIPKEPKKKRNI
jgi:hypothetical protein